jgi:hypothetical protein
MRRCRLLVVGTPLATGPADVHKVGRDVIEEAPDVHQAGVARGTAGAPSARGGGMIVRSCTTGVVGRRGGVHALVKRPLGRRGGARRVPRRVRRIRSDEG